MATEWEFDTPTRRYRDTRIGRFLSAREVHALRETYVIERQAMMRAFIETSLGAIDPTDMTAWRTGVARVSRLGWRRIENTLITEYVYGRGGIHAMGAAETAELRGLLSTQRRYWRGFIAELREEPQSVGRIAARADLYHGASRSCYERAHSRAWGIDLPAYPGDGRTVCLGHCHCRWSIRPRGDTIEATWELGAAEHCGDCQDNAARWSPLIFEVPSVPDDEDAA